MQFYHSNAKTNIHIRQYIQNNKSTSGEDFLAEKYNISPRTVSKWETGILTMMPQVP